MRIALPICVAAIAGTCGAAQAQPDRLDSITQPPVSALTEYWTAQRLREAAPMPVPVVDPRTGGSVSPDNSLSQAVPNDLPDAALPSSVNGNVATRPLYWAGRIFFARPDGGGYCSTQFIAPGLLLMAAHCVRDEQSGAWFTNFLYVHGYDRGNGRKVATQCASAYDGWLAKDDSRWMWDYAMIKLRGGNDIGHFGYQWGWWGQYNGVPKIGYPQDIEGGEVIQVEFGKLFQSGRRNIVGLYHNNPRNQEGSSGGGWIGKFETSGDNSQSNYVISVTSHYWGDDKTKSYGPYWDGNNFQKLMAYTNRGCK
jgi:hypothetical protein